MTPKLQAGERLGQYQLLSRIGQGGMASVWVARLVSPSGQQRLVAIKVMLPELAKESSFRWMFLEEGQLVSSIDHDNVVRIYEVGEEQGVLFMVMEWVEGASVRTIIREARKRRAIPPEMAVRMIADTAAGLHAAHELRGYDGKLKKLVHCDVSPHNILIGLDGNAKLVDFGVASATAHSKVASNEVKGKVGYMSPEQARAGPIDRRSDIFALGIVLFELTTGERLFQGENMAHTLQLVTKGNIPRPSEVYARYPKALEKIVQRALERDPDRRFQTADDFRKALEGYLYQERIMVPKSGVAQLLRRVAGTRIEKQRKDIRQALVELDGQIPQGLVPDRPAVGSRPGHHEFTGSSALSVTKPEGRARSRPSQRQSTPSSSQSAPATQSEVSTNTETATAEPQTLDHRPRVSRSSVAFAALGVSAAIVAIVWVLGHKPDVRAGSNAATTTPRALPDSAQRKEPFTVPATAKEPTAVEPTAKEPTAVEQGISIDSLPAASLEVPAPLETPAPTPAVSSARRRTSTAVKASNKPAQSAEAGQTLDAGKAPEADLTNPYAPESTGAPQDRPPLSRGATIAALSAAASRTRSCAVPRGPSGQGNAQVTFSPDGVVSQVRLSAPFAGTAVGTCVSGVFKSATVPPFSGNPVTLSSGFVVP